MTNVALRAWIERERLIAIVRIADDRLALSALRGLVAAGIGTLELSLATSGPEQIDLARRECPDALIGAGTVTTVTDAREATAAGAQFLVSPNLDLDIVRWAAAAEVLHIPGALTPTELLLAHTHGAALVKLFPAGMLGPRYLREILAPMPWLRLVPTGGITAQNAREFLAAGAAALGVGTTLASVESAMNSELLGRNVAAFRAAMDSPSHEESR